MSKRFDVVIVGAGPAGLACAEMFKGSAISVLVLERQKEIGPKPCAGGIVEALEALPVPEQKANILHSHQIHVKTRIHRFSSKTPVKIVDRRELGQYQLKRLAAASNIEIRTGVAVHRIDGNRIHTGDGEFGYNFLVGADGAGSLVRRHLNLPSRYTVGMYCDMPAITDQIIIYLDGKSLGTGYIWEFPHQRFTNLGIHYNPARLTTAQARNALHAYIMNKQYRIDVKNFRAFPIMHLYRGCCFENRIFLAGDAAGLASKLTGEGISFAVISGREVARKILNPAYDMDTLRLLIERKRKQDRMIDRFEKIPTPMLNVLFGLFLETWRRNFISL